MDNDSENEEKFFQSYMKIVDSIQSHNAIIREEAKRQDAICGKLWSLSQRIAVLRRGIPGYRIFPSDLAYTVECELLNDFQTNYSKLCESTIICKSFEALQSLLREFNTKVRSLDGESTNPSIRNVNKKQLQFYLNFINDAVECFQSFLVSVGNLKYLIKTYDANTIETYQSFLRNEASEFDIPLSLLSMTKNMTSVSGRA